jgi:DNA-binding response OmpR family regulator
MRHADCTAPGMTPRSTGDELGSNWPVVYIVDDDIVTLTLLCEIASDAGWEARGFERLGALRHAVDAAPPDLLILDDDLPDGRGGELARRLRDDRALAGVPVVVCTAAHPMRRAEIGRWAPVIAKPFDIGVIDRLLEDARPDRRRAHRHRAG